MNIIHIMQNDPKLTEQQNILDEQLKVVVNITHTSEKQQKVIERVTRIINGLVDASNAFNSSSDDYAASVAMLTTTVEVL